MKYQKLTNQAWPCILQQTYKVERIIPKGMGKRILISDTDSTAKGTHTCNMHRLEFWKIWLRATTLWLPTQLVAPLHKQHSQSNKKRSPLLARHLPVALHLVSRAKNVPLSSWSLNYELILRRIRTRTWTSDSGDELARIQEVISSTTKWLSYGGISSNLQTRVKWYMHSRMLSCRSGCQNIEINLKHQEFH